MEINPNFYQPEEPTAARLREQFKDFLATIPAPSEMSDDQLHNVGEVVAQVWNDIIAASEVITAEEVRRGLLPPDEEIED
ncbi:hypothetical protein G3I13_01795 [Streptomyces sp. SID6673]|nr:hypothetical protein [Streptomyces sp. SID11726]NDZ94893.1 hypothetical protein [Streptomyces sp. SID11726]NEB23053.1 hypothetical protein [Streptomyces sp. SID6673]